MLAHDGGAPAAGPGLACWGSSIPTSTVCWDLDEEREVTFSLVTLGEMNGKPPGSGARNTEAFALRRFR